MSDWNDCAKCDDLRGYLESEQSAASNLRAVLASRDAEIARLTQESQERIPSWMHERVVEGNKELKARCERYRGALEVVAKPTYGTELCNSDEENNEILDHHLFINQRIARQALKEPQEETKDE